ncbi:hypothetical protein [Polyangium aurulentum]|uniref:hypothetical protein n=1 Tax=Polyangium aurulentum TaxID=2567896 RepID=UPI0020108A5C|nr:hypothetical protein [Polyangium aurulentum]UQA56730.1 hypothetical protein E8A73_036325 [Polyangium aurulentum]
MAKLVLGLAALFLCGSMGMDSGAENPSLPVDGASARQVVPELGEVVETSAGSAGRPIVGGRISEEERERRVQECERLYEACYDWCSRSKGGPKCYTECSKKNTECMEKIPYAVKD